MNNSSFNPTSSEITWIVYDGTTNLQDSANFSYNSSTSSIPYSQYYFNTNAINTESISINDEDYMLYYDDAVDAP